MQELCYNFSVNLHEKLKEKIIAHIYCKVDSSDTLFVSIKRFENIDKFKFEIRFEDFSMLAANGWSSEHAAYEITQKYRAFIRNKFFINDKES